MTQAGMQSYRVEDGKLAETLDRVATGRIEVA
jgi:hypothetical protein